MTDFDKETGELLEILNCVEDQQELIHYIEDHTLNCRKGDFLSYLLLKAEQKKLSKKEIVANSKIYRTYAYQILQGIRQPSRDKLIAICVGMHLNLEETQRILKLAGVGLLYPRVRRDAILIFVIHKSIDVLGANSLLYDMGEKILD